VLKVHYSYEPQGSCLGASCLRPRLTQLCFFFFIFHIHFLSSSHFSSKFPNRICVMNCFSQHVFGLFFSIYCFYTVYNFIFLCFLLCFIVAFFPHRKVRHFLKKVRHLFWIFSTPPTPKISSFVTFWWQIMTIFFRLRRANFMLNQKPTP
jgi:hypothetical protein